MYPVFVLLWAPRVSVLAQQLVVDPACEATSITDTAWNLTAWRDKLRGSSVVTCDKALRGDGRCDFTNNMNENQCDYDGGDCCLTTCIANCMARQQESDHNLVDLPYRNPSGRAGECAFMCGSPLGAVTNCPYLCLSDDYTDKGIAYTSWCQTTRGQPREMSKCYSTKVDIAEALRQCIMNDKSHGNMLTSSYECGNQTQQCTLDQALDQSHGCHLHPKQCTREACCTMAIEMGWIDPNVRVLPSLCDLVRRCESFPTCMPAMSECVRLNKACTGGCCMCESDKWYGANCDQPLCWPKCRHGACVAPNVCHCDEGWSGPSCEIAFCDPPCKAGQGVCAWPDRCECFYGWSGTSCEVPVSYPPCVNGEAICPDVCKCKPGWGGRICDYPLCQHWPEPSSDCGHGYCESPNRCVCDPGWTHLVTKGQDGIDELPFWWRGRSGSAEISPSEFVYGDTRFVQNSETDYQFDRYNAFKCDMPVNCKIISDGHCATCEPVTGRCLTCEPGFFLVSPPVGGNSTATSQTGRCHQCNLRWRRCRSCSAERCLSCDPLFVMREGHCISEGIIEFSSPAYHVFSDEQFVVVEIIRSFDTVDFDWVLSDRSHTPVVVVQAIDSRTASSVSGAKQKLADFESTMQTVEFGIVSNASADAFGHNAFAHLLNFTNSSGNLVTSSGDFYSGVSWRSEALQAVTLRHSVKIPIFDNGIYDEKEKFFTVRLLVESETTAGSIMPMTPFLPHFERDDVTAVPRALSQRAQLDETKVYIWDRSDTASASNTILRPDSPIATGEIFRTGPQVGTIINVDFVAQKCVLEGANGCDQLGPVDTANDVARFIVVTEPTTKGSSEHMLGDVLYARKAVTLTGLYRSYSVPFVAGPFRVYVQRSLPGVTAMYYSWSPEPAAYQLPDIIRVDHSLTHDWRSGRDSPRYVRWTGYLQWDCLRNRYDRLGSMVPTLLGVTVSAQSWVRVTWKNLGVVLEEYRAGHSWMTNAGWGRANISDVQREGCTPGERRDGIYCFAIAGGEPSVANEFVSATRALGNSVEVDVAYPFIVEYRPAHSADSMDRPVGISLVMYLPPSNHSLASIGPGWVEVPKACLAAGVDIEGSPLEGMWVRAGVPAANVSLLRPAESTVDGIIRAIATEVITAEIVLRDAQQNIVIDASFGPDIAVQLASPALLGTVEWVPSGAFYLAAIALPSGTPEVTTVMVATLSGQYIGSPIPVVVQAAASDISKAQVVGNFSEIEANEPTCFSILSFDSGGNARTAGGDQYKAVAVGPRHSPRPSMPIETILDNGDGTYGVCFQLMDPGVYDLDVTLGGISIPGSPFAINILGTIDPSSSTITNLTSVAVAGEVVNIGVNAIDKYGQPYFQGSDLNLTLDLGPLYNPSAGDFSQLVNIGDGTISVSFAICTAGETTVSVRASTEAIDGTTASWQHVLGSPFQLTVLPGRANARNSPLRVSGIMDGVIGMGIGARLLVEVRDGCGNALDDPPILDDWNITLVRSLDGSALPMTDQAIVRESSIDIPFIPRHSGNYTALCGHRLTGACAGSPLVFTVVHTLELPDEPHEYFTQPFLLEYVGASNHTSAIGEVPGVTTVTAGEEATVRIQARDLWSDVIFEHNISLSVGFWLDGVHCNTRCRSMVTLGQCLGLPGCAFDSNTATCEASPLRSIPQEGIPSCLYSPYVVPHGLLLGDPVDGTYEFSVRLLSSGLNLGQATVLRPGGLAAQWFLGSYMRAENMVCTTVIPGPLNRDWWSASWASLLPCGLTDRRFSVRLVGHVNFPKESDDLTVTLKTRCRLHMVQPFVISNQDSVREGTTTLGGIQLSPGLYEVRIELSCVDIRQLSEAFFEWWLGDDDEYFWQPVPASWLAWEEPLREGFNRTVRPASQASVLSWADENPTEGRAGDNVSLYVDTRDAYGNFLETRDVQAFVEVSGGDPELLDWQWSVVPSTGPRYRIDVYPNRATQVQLVAVQLYNNPASRISTSFKVWSNFVDRTTSELICTPLSPQPANTLIECTIILRDVAGNEIPVASVDSELSRTNELGPVLVDVDFFTPNGGRGSTHAKVVEGQASTGFQFQPTEAGLWGVQGFVYYPRVNKTIWLDGANYTISPGPSHPCCATSSLPSSMDLLHNQTLTYNITAHDRYGNVVKDGSDTWYVYFEGPTAIGNGSSPRVFPDTVSYVGDGNYNVTFAPHSFLPSSTWQSRFGLVVRDTTVVKCPTPLPSNAYVRELTNLRAAGSVAYMQCLEGYTPVGGSDILICGEDGLWRTRNLEPQKPLACGRVLDLCPDLNAHVEANPGVRLEFLSSWTMDVGAMGTLECAPGFLPLLGDSELTCGGSGHWRRRADSAPAILLKCFEKADLCPDLRSGLNGSYLASLSKQRMHGSIASLKCLEGHVAVDGNSTAYCGAKETTFSNGSTEVTGLWMSSAFDASGEPVPAVPLKCARRSGFCATLSLGPYTKAINWTATGLGSYIGDVVDLGCVTGSFPVRGLERIRCGAAGQWFDPDSPSGLSPVTPSMLLDCQIVQDFCPPHGIDANISTFRREVALDDLSMANAVNATAGTVCAPGYERTSGDETYSCAPDPSNSSRGVWFGLPSGSLMDTLQCRRLGGYCPAIPHSASFNVTYLQGANATLDSVIKISCGDAYYLRSNLTSVAPTNTFKCASDGQWVSIVDLSSSGNISALHCWPRLSQCRGYVPAVGVRVRHYTSQGLGLGTVARLGCDVGWKTASNASYVVSQNVTRLNLTDGSNSTYWEIVNVTASKAANFTDRVVCAEGGTWEPSSTNFSNPYALQCEREVNFCPFAPPVYSAYNGSLRVVPVNTTRGPVYIQVTRPHAVRGGRLTIACGEQDYHYAGGDRELICGLGPDGLGQWKSLATGAPAEPLFCYNSLPIVGGSIFNAFSHGCAESDDGDLPMYPGRLTSGAVVGRNTTIAMWVKTGCRVPAYGTAQYLVRLRASGVSPIYNRTGVVWSGQASHTESVSLKITTNNTLEAVVGGGCGEITGVAGSPDHISLSGQCLDWMHIALAWDALAPGSNMEVYVNGRRTGVSYSHRVSGFCFDNLMTAADYAGAELAFGDGNWSMNGTHPISGLAIAGVRMYSRRLNASEVASLMSSERPSCSYAHDDCPDISSSMVNTRSIAYGSAVSNETRFPLHWRMGGNWAHYGCIPG
ncbi:hypothetical protein FOZ61_000939 [Perkinsus olseni]|nr:hypothetical protein FOZ61_000939 [Perkinsus olseni]